MSFVWSIVKAILATFFGDANEDFLTLRAQANVEGDKMSAAFERSKLAQGRRNRALAVQYREEGLRHKEKMEELNKKASDLVFAENNKDRGPGEVDFHGLYVKEAIERTKTAITDAKKQGFKELRLIVGKGLHSQGGEARIKPAIEELMRTYRLTAKVDPRNAGVLIVFIGSSAGPVGLDEIARNLEGKEGGCLVM